MNHINIKARGVKGVCVALREHGQVHEDEEREKRQKES